MILNTRTKLQRGFTLIELIAVIIIMGILASVIVPKYFDMTDNARNAALRGAVTEGVARFNMAYAQYIVINSSRPTTITSLQASNLLGNSLTNINIGDFTLDYAASGTSGVSITAKGPAGATTQASTIVAWPQ